MSKINPIQLQKYLVGVDYPASKEDLVKQAKAHGADDNAVQMLQHLPDQSFQTPADVSQAVGKLE